MLLSKQICTRCVKDDAFVNNNRYLSENKSFILFPALIVISSSKPPSFSLRILMHLLLKSPKEVNLTIFLFCSTVIFTVSHITFWSENILFNSSEGISMITLYSVDGILSFS